MRRKPSLAAVRSLVGDAGLEPASLEGSQGLDLLHRCAIHEVDDAGLRLLVVEEQVDVAVAVEINRPGSPVCASA
jgi:hypothetical protein